LATIAASNALKVLAAPSSLAIIPTSGLDGFSVLDFANEAFLT